jgi:hypothetical protein
VRHKEFSYKAYLFEYPITSVSLVFIAICSVLGYWYYLAERHERTGDAELGGNGRVQNYWEGWWVLAMGGLTVGYSNNMSPYTHFGRLALVFSPIITIFLIATLVLAFYNYLRFDRQEMMAYVWIYKYN